MAIFQRSNGDNNNSFNQGVSNALGKVNTKSVLRYTMMPEILPRIRALGLHFGHFAYLLALVFSSARLIPATHPVLNAANIGRYGVRQVIAMAANNITWSRQNIDQIAIFTAIVMGLIMIVIQAGLIAFAALVGFNPAQAQSVDSFFVPGAPYVAANDPVMVLFANVFGDLNNFWGAGVAGVAPNSGNIIHDAVRAMLKLYSMAMMVIAVIIIVYYIMTVVGEAAKTGTPFGQRFNSLWAPIRLVVALGLLVPLGSGLNSAQYITLWIAKMGSGLGTTFWVEAMKAMNTSSADRFILGEFNDSWVRNLSFQVFLMEVCAQGHNKYNEIQANSNSDDFVKPTELADRDISEPAREGTRNIPARAATNAYRVEYKDKGADYWIAKDTLTNCGVIEVSMSEADYEASLTGGAQAVPVNEIFNASKAAINQIVDSTVIKKQAEILVGSSIPTGGGITHQMPAGGMKTLLDAVMGEADRVETALRTSLGGAPNTNMAAEMKEFIDSRRNSWVYAGTFYMEIARIIQASHDARLNAIPNTAIVGIDAELDVVSTSGRNNTGRGGSQRGGTIFRINGSSEEVATAVLNARTFFTENQSDYIRAEELPAACVGIGNENPSFWNKAGCFILSIIVPDNLVLLAQDSSRDVDPLAALIKAGYEIIDRSWKALLIGLSTGAAGPLLNFVPGVGGVLSAFAAAFSSIAVLFAVFGLAAGVTLYFMLPILPFMYFFFAVVSWIMEIFEAIIAMPLWALAHLRIDGDGMPGQAAINGYYLLLAILLRPALIVISLIAGIVIFSGVTFLLQTLWNDVLLVKGAGNMSGLEVLVYTVVFAYFCYSAGLTSFKLVDTIPNQILRWIGSGTPTFSEGKEDPMGQSNALLTGGAAFLAGQGLQGVSQGMSGIGKGIYDKKQESDAIRKKNTDGAASQEFQSKQTDRIISSLNRSSGD